MPLIFCLASASATFIGKTRRQLAGGFREPLALARKNNCSLQSTFFSLNSIHNNVTFCRETFQKQPQAENSPKCETGSVDFWHSTKTQTLPSRMDTRFMGLLLLAAPSLQCSMCSITCPCFYITPDLYFTWNILVSPCEIPSCLLSDEAWHAVKEWDCSLSSFRLRGKRNYTEIYFCLSNLGISFSLFCYIRKTKNNTVNSD